jgi:hydroxyacylglutathione hydrolase
MNCRCLAKVIVLLLTTLILAACSGTITRAELRSRQAERPPPLLIDVRSAGEYTNDHIPGALQIPFYTISTGLEERSVQKNSPIILYCEHGPRAGLAGISLYFHGYGKVYSLEGHMKGWRDSGGKLAR